MIHGLAKRSKGTSSLQEPAEGDIRATQRFSHRIPEHLRKCGQQTKWKVGVGETRDKSYFTSRSYHQEAGTTDRGKSRLRDISQTGGWRYRNENEGLNEIMHPDTETPATVFLP